MHPFVFFPIVPPYSQWHPELGTNVPECTAVCEQMEKVSPEAQPFISTWYCMEFLKHCAITNPSGFKYSTLASNLDAMLLWSFHTHVPLLDWKEQQVRRFLDFYCDPPVGCTGSAVHSRFVEECSVPFRDWAINPEWRLFRRTASGPGSLTPITREPCRRLASHLQHFFDFYKSSTGSPRANPAAEAPRLTWKLPISKGSVVLTEKQLDWLFTDALSSRVHARQSLQVMVYLGLARYTDLTAKQIIGNFNAGFTLDRLRLESDGGATKAAIHSYSLSQRFSLRDTSVKVLEIAPPWVDTDLIHKSGDERAMPLGDFIQETLAKLESATTEVLVDRVVPLRANQGANEHELIHQFNQSLVDNPIPVA